MKNLQELLVEIKNLLPRNENLVTFVLDDKLCFIEVFEMGIHIVIRYEDVYDEKTMYSTKQICASLYSELLQDDLSAAYLKDLAAICDLVEENAHIFETLLSPIDKN